MKKNIFELSALVGGTFWGDASVLITGAQTFREAEFGEITFFDTPSRWEEIKKCRASAVLVPCVTDQKIEEGLKSLSIPVIQVEEVHQAFIKIVELFRPPVERPNFGVHPQAILGENVSLGQDVTIFPGVFIGNDVIIEDHVIIYPHCTIMEKCRVGAGTTLFPGVTLYEKCVVGKNCILHAGATIGAYGFGYQMRDERHILSAQLGNVELGDFVEIGANSTIDRGTYGTTRVGEGTKIDNLVMIGHNCQIGKHNLLCSQVGIAGSTITGDYVVMAGQVGVRDHVKIGSRVTFGAQAGVASDTAEEGTYLGSPAVPIQEMKRIFVVQKQLPEYWKTLKKIAKDAQSGEIS
ncbi:MAG: UDP-3-O-(3-hydroxymyristoyl)glucosamine N-acyltransferase [Planctomycetia bacterium]|nr:UDP-3-O-(3-hydroxymyristoyl)glucosamine N-acyltransferase [Planctomycetia bacterium]